jgi:2-hydroxy-4-(methylsulfanyl)butanoate S-methyltransferase
MATSMDELQSLLWNFAGHRVITVASRTGVLRELADGATIAQISDRLDLDPLATGKLVRALASLGVVLFDGNTYSIVPELAPHFRAGAKDLTPYIEHSHRMYEEWGTNLEKWLKGENWPTRSRNTANVRNFGDAMQAMSTLMAGKVVDALQLDSTKKILDVGGSIGGYARAYCRANPELRAFVLDVPEVANYGREVIDTTEYSDRIEFISGDYFEADWGREYDLVQIANILHMETPQRAAGLIKRAQKALVVGGRIVIVDFIIDDQQENRPIGALFAINMRSFGDTYTEPTISNWMHAAGLVDIQRIDISSTHWIITGQKAG